MIELLLKFFPPLFFHPNILIISAFTEKACLLVNMYHMLIVIRRQHIALIGISLYTCISCTPRIVANMPQECRCYPTVSMVRKNLKAHNAFHLSFHGRMSRHQPWIATLIVGIAPSDRRSGRICKIPAKSPLIYQLFSRLLCGCAQILFPARNRSFDLAVVLLVCHVPTGTHAGAVAILLYSPFT